MSRSDHGFAGRDHYSMFAPAVWQATAPLRHALHRTQGAGWWCPTRVAPYSPADPAGSAAGPACADCVSEHGEILCLTCRRYAGRCATVDDPGGWAFRVAECLMLDRFRGLRVEAGALARTDDRGVAGRVYRACATPWQRRLARLILDYVGYRGPLPPDLWPYGRWLAEKTAVTGVVQEGPAAVSRLHDDIVAVAGLMRAHGGTVTVDGERLSWYEAYVERPLGRRRRIDTVSLDQGRDGGDGPCPIDPPDAGLVLGYTDRLIRDCAELAAEGVGTVPALRSVLPRLFGARGLEVCADRPALERLARRIRPHLPES